MNGVENSSISELADRLRQAFQPEKIILFGSHAWGNPDKDSDIDICVVVKESADREIDRMVRAREATQGIWVAKDIIVKTEAYMDKYSPIVSSLAHKIYKSGVTLYERKG